jgi:hypothetical protein
MTPQRLIELRDILKRAKGFSVSTYDAGVELADAYEALRKAVRAALPYICVMDEVGLAATLIEERAIDRKVALEMLLDHPEPGSYMKKGRTP